MRLQNSIYQVALIKGNTMFTIFLQKNIDSKLLLVLI